MFLLLRPMFIPKSQILFKVLSVIFEKYDGNDFLWTHLNFHEVAMSQNESKDKILN